MFLQLFNFQTWCLLDPRPSLTVVTQYKWKVLFPGLQQLFMSNIKISSIKWNVYSYYFQNDSQESLQTSWVNSNFVARWRKWFPKLKTKLLLFFLKKMEMPCWSMLRKLQTVSDYCDSLVASKQTEGCFWDYMHIR